MTYKKKICIICNKSFTPTSGVQKCCTKECYSILRNKTAKNWYWNNLSKARQTKRRWNNSDNGKNFRKQYYKVHKEKIFKSLEKYKDASYARIKSARILRRTRIEWICSNCHDPSKKPNVHHKDLNPFNDNLNNLILLCRDCHSNLHHDLNLVVNRNPSFVN